MTANVYYTLSVNKTQRVRGYQEHTWKALYECLAL